MRLAIICRRVESLDGQHVIGGHKKEKNETKGSVREHFVLFLFLTANKLAGSSSRIALLHASQSNLRLRNLLFRSSFSPFIKKER